jgi:hypothetical protein
VERERGPGRILGTVGAKIEKLHARPLYSATEPPRVEAEGGNSYVDLLSGATVAVAASS